MSHCAISITVSSGGMEIPFLYIDATGFDLKEMWNDLMVDLIKEKLRCEVTIFLVILFLVLFGWCVL